jgi:hypothetical protein
MTMTESIWSRRGVGVVVDVLIGKMSTMTCYWHTSNWKLGFQMLRFEIYLIPSEGVARTYFSVIPKTPNEDTCKQHRARHGRRPVLPCVIILLHVKTVGFIRIQILLHRLDLSP